MAISASRLAPPHSTRLPEPACNDPREATRICDTSLPGTNLTTSWLEQPLVDRLHMILTEY